jgi:hypothetical protein
MAGAQQLAAALGRADAEEIMHCNFHPLRLSFDPYGMLLRDLSLCSGSPGLYISLALRLTTDA